MLMVVGVLMVTLCPVWDTKNVKAQTSPTAVPINIVESIGVGDSPDVVPTVTIQVVESIGVSDSPDIVPPVTINVVESIGVSDSPDIVPTVTIQVVESIGVGDSPDIVPSVVINVVESIGVSDSSALLPSVMITVIESIGVYDSPQLIPPVSIIIIESIGISEAYFHDLGPIAAFTWSPEPQDEGSPVQFTDASTSYPDDIISWSWDFDGLGTSSEQNPTFTFEDDGFYDVDLTVTDDDGSTDTICHTVTVNNVAPQITSVANSGPINEGSSATVSGTFTDPGILDTFTVTIDWGDGLSNTFSYPAGSTAFSETHQYHDDDPTGTASDDYTVQVTVADDDGGSDTDTTTVTVNNVAPQITSVANSGPINEGSSATITVSATDPAGASDPLSYEFDCDNNGSYETGPHSGNSASCPFADDGIYQVNVRVTDDDGGVAIGSTTVTVLDLGPTAAFNWSPEPQDEGSAIAFTDTSTSFPDSIVAWSWDFAGVGTSTDQNPSFTFMDDGTYNVCLTVTDDDGSTDTICHNVTIANLAPALACDLASQSVQYSDHIADVTFTATDVASDSMTASGSWSVDGGSFTAGLPGFLSLADEGCAISGNTNACTWTLEGIAGVPEGMYTVRVTVEDDDGGQTEVEVTITVLSEDASVAFEGDNPVAVLVDTPGGDSGPFSLTVYVSETEPDLPEASAALGDISLASVSVNLVPVGPGSPVSGVCTPGTVVGTGYDSVLPVTCAFDDVPVNTYAVEVTVGGGYYAGAAQDVLTVYDPSLGFATGGGWFYWPETSEKTNFGFTMKYNKKATKVQGSLLIIRHCSDGSIYRMKSNALYGLAVGESLDPAFGWASFSGKGTYKDKEWLEPIGNYEFVAYVEDHNEPGTGHDQFWIEVLDKERNVIGEMSMDREAVGHTTTLGGGNIVVPHGGG
jgi:PKD repeat protein